jgi:hypothetical protein
MNIAHEAAPAADDDDHDDAEALECSNLAARA